MNAAHGVISAAGYLAKGMKLFQAKQLSSCIVISPQFLASAIVAVAVGANAILLPDYQAGEKSITVLFVNLIWLFPSAFIT